MLSCSQSVAQSTCYEGGCGHGEVCDSDYEVECGNRNGRMLLGQVCDENTCERMNAEKSAGASESRAKPWEIVWVNNGEMRTPSESITHL